MIQNPYESPSVEGTHSAVPNPRRLWGVDLIASMYALAVIAMAWMMAEGDLPFSGLLLVLLLLTAGVAVGLYLRFNPARVLLLVLVALAMVPDAMLAIGGIVQAISERADGDLAEDLGSRLIRLFLSAAMFYYLRRPAVREAFRRNKKEPDAPSTPVAER